MEFKNIEFRPIYSHEIQVITNSKSIYQIDVDNHLISGGYFGDQQVPFTQIGASFGRNPNKTPKNFIAGVENILPGRQLSAYIEGKGWLNTSTISNVSRVTNIRSNTAEYVNYRGAMIPKEQFDNLVCEQRLIDEKNEKAMADIQFERNWMM